jgi:hypothetical protein
MSENELKVEVEESGEYDNFIGKSNVSKGVTGILGLEEETTVEPVFENPNSWKKHWKGMPEFDQDNNPPYKTIYLHFRDEEDYKEFAKLVEQNLSEKTKSIWYPKLDRDANSLKRWIEE